MNMYDKRKIRKNKASSNEPVENKTNINCLITICLIPVENSLCIRICEDTLLAHF